MCLGRAINEANITVSYTFVSVRNNNEHSTVLMFNAAILLPQINK